MIFPTYDPKQLIFTDSHLVNLKQFYYHIQSCSSQNKINNSNNNYD